MCKGKVVVRGVRFSGAQDGDESAGEDAHEMANGDGMLFALGAFVLVVSF